MRRDASPTPEFKAALLSRVMGSPAPRSALRYALVGIASLVLVFGTGTGVYAYESPDVVDGHPLYFVKSAVEKVESRFAISPEQRDRHEQKMLRRRAGEASRHRKAGR